MASSLRDIREGTTIIIASAAVISLLFLPLTATTNNGALLQSGLVFAQQEQGGSSPLGFFSGGGDQQQGSEQQGGEVVGTASTTITNDTTTEPTDFLTYENPDHGIFMQYPSNWMASTSGLADYTDLIAFYSPLQNVSDLSQARLIISVITYSQNVSLQEYTNYLWTILNQSEQVDIRSSSEVDIAGYPGHRVVLANQPNQNTTLTFYQMNTWTTIGNKGYFLTYQGEEPAFNQYLPEVSQMIESLIIE